MKHFVYFFSESAVSTNGYRTKRLALYELQGSQMVRIANITDHSINEKQMLIAALAESKALPADEFTDNRTSLRRTSYELAEQGVAMFHTPGEWHKGAKVGVSTHQARTPGHEPDAEAQWAAASCSHYHTAPMHWAVFGRYHGDDEARVLCQVVADDASQARIFARARLADDADGREIYIDAVVGAHAALTVE